MCDQKSIRRGLFLILLVGAALRFGGISGQGYPFSYYDDEAGNVKRSMRFYDPEEGRFDLNPHWFNKPAFAYYINFGAYGFYYLFGRYVSGEFASPGDFGRFFVNNQGPFYIIGRLLVSIFAILNIWVVYRLGRRLFTRREALFAASMLAISVGHVTWSHVVKKDVLAGLLCSLAMCFVAKIMAKGRVRDYVFAGFFAGLGVGTKYYPVILAAPILLAFLYDQERSKESFVRRMRCPLAAALALVGGFFVASPYNFLDPTWALHNLKGVLLHLKGMLGFGAGDVDPSRDSLFKQLWRGFLVFTGFREGDWGFTVPLTALFLAGLGTSFRVKYRRVFGPHVLLIVCHFLLLSVALELDAHKNHFIMIFPSATLVATLGFREILGRFGLNAETQPRRVLTGLLILLLMPIPGFTGFESLRRVITCQTPPSYSVAFDWIQRELPAGTTLINDNEILALRYDDVRLEWLRNRIRDTLKVSDERLRVSRDAGELAHHDRRRDRYRAYRLEHELLFQGAATYPWRKYDVIVLMKPWQTEKAEDVDSKRYGYNDLWDYQPLAEPPEFAYRPAAYTVVPSAQSVVGRKLTPVFEGRPVEYFLSSEKSYTNYKKPHRRAAFPHWATFYDDLEASYKCWEFNSNHDRPGPTLRIYDLRQRVTQPQVIRVDR